VQYPLDAIETPAVLVDGEVLVGNIGEAARRATAADVSLRPHVKSHKSARIAKMQIDAGAVGITVAKSSEALPFIEAGIADIVVAHPLVDGRKIARLLEVAARRGTRLALIADSAAGVATIATEAVRQGVTVAIRIKIDVGLHRCGADPRGEDALILARMIADHSHLTFGGILSHAGHAYAAADADGVRAIAGEERRIMLDVAGRIRDIGIAVPVISIGSTPTFWLDAGFDGISEARPGNYVFMDMTQASLGIVPRSRIALSVLTTVVSCNDTYAIIDAGSKVLSSDRGPHGSTRLNGYGLALPLDNPDAEGMLVASVSEEHGFVAHRGQRPQIGERLRIIPNHACTVVNLTRSLFVGDADDGYEIWPVDAQNCVL
jgi:D-serine deaminase-like pyridoxal phosphate-dependent protein